MAEYINRKILVDLVLLKLKFMGDARIMNQNDEKVLSEIDGYEKAINAVYELILDKDLIENVKPVKYGRWEQIGEQSAKCTACGGVLKSNGIDKTGKALIFNAVYHYCPYCGARMDGDAECK